MGNNNNNNYYYDYDDYNYYNYNNNNYNNHNHNDHNREDDHNRGEFHNNSGRGGSLLHHHRDRATSKLREGEVTFQKTDLDKYSGKQSHKCPSCFIYLYAKNDSVVLDNCHIFYQRCICMHPEIVLVVISVVVI